MKHDLLLTLGHNSSAILVKDGKIVCGYEEERLSDIKSDSHFPQKAIERCMKIAGINFFDETYVSHWAPDGNIASMSKKHWIPLSQLGKIHSTDQSFTHHDAHAQSAAWYAFSKPGLKRDNTMVFVIDGFGNFGEHISIYKMTGYGPQLIRRFYGYGGSLGLMYQYMTAFMGMKMHEDEYKILGYEVQIESMDIDMQVLHHEINKEVTRVLDGYFDNKKMFDGFDPLLRLDALPALQKSYIDRWTALCRRLFIEPTPSNELRVILGYYIQSVLEGVVLTLIKIYNPTNLVCAGGVFYNVKLNRRILDFIPGKLCVFPLAGDQGAALGLYTKSNDLTWPGHLNWGIRPRPETDAMSVVGSTGIISLSPDHDPTNWMLEELNRRGFVNLVRGAMEFGPRALCNTSTIALPKPSIVSQINKMNNRNTVMPMAPVMNRSEYKARMKLTEKVHMSEEHMIVALPYKVMHDVLGAAHQYSNEWTGRPQVLDGDPVMDQLFAHYPVLINTSFNYHGRPIVYDWEDMLLSHEQQLLRGSIVTIYKRDEQ